MKLQREDVYIANILKCRPPGNRNPLPDEMANCIKYLHTQIDMIRPAVIVTLGSVASRTLLDTGTGITRLRGTFHEFRVIPVMPTYHPAYLLRNPAKKAETWEDIKKVMLRAGLPIPA
jgi:DNA polymerase